MAKKSTYQCILYEVGDVVVPLYPDPFKVSTTQPRTIVEVREGKVGNHDVQYIYFDDDPDRCDINISNHFRPVGDTVIKYKEQQSRFKSAVEQAAQKKSVVKRTRTTEVEEEEQVIAYKVIRIPKPINKDLPKGEEI